MIVLGVNITIFLVSALGQRRTGSHLDVFGGSQPRELLRREFEENLLIVNTLHIVNIDEGEPDLSAFGFSQIRSSSVNKDKWSNRLIIVSINGLFLEDEKSWSRPLVEFFVREFNGLSIWISAFILDEHLL
jgi:hypothetical protein